jgi:hypothetical protein
VALAASRRHGKPWGAFDPGGLRQVRLASALPS